MILLTGKELSELQLYQEPDNESIGYEKNIAKAQVKKMRNWGNETCTNQQHRTYYITMAEDAYYTKRHECKFCWQELEKEIEK